MPGGLGTLAQGTFAGLAGRAIAVVSAPACLAIVSRAVVSTDLSRYLLFVASVGLVGSALQFGLRAQFSRSSDSEVGPLLRVMTLALAISIPVSIGAAPVLSLPFLPLAMALASYPLEASLRGIAARFEDVPSLLLLNILRGTTRVGCFVLLWRSGVTSLEIFLLAWAGSQAVPVGAVFLRLKSNLLGRASGVSMVPLRRSVILAVSTLGPTALQRLDVAFASQTLLGPEAAAYLATRQILDLPVVLISAVETFLIQYFLQVDSQDRERRILQIALVVGGSTALCAAALVPLTGPLAEVLLGAEVSTGADAWLLGAATGLASASAILTQGAFAKRSEGRAAIASAAVLVVNFSLLTVVARDPSRTRFAAVTLSVYAAYNILLYAAVAANRRTSR